MTEKQLILDDSRRLTGPNLFGSKPGVIIEVLISGYDKEFVISCWHSALKAILQELNWNQEKIFSRIYNAGASLGFTAPIDVLYAATEVNEAAWIQAVNSITGIKNDDFATTIEKLQNEINSESNPALLALKQAANENQVRFLSDDDFVSIGYGASCQVFPIDKIPPPSQIDWAAIQSIPLALVTGTNGKSTSVRLASHIIKTSGLRCGITSTDYIRIDENILDSGDYSGPGGARTLLRHQDTEVAILEVARGGMLRRGLGVNQAHCGAITNVAEDHLGDYGIDTVEDMIATKFVVREALNKQQDLILNADDDGVVEFAERLDNHLVWFSWDKNNQVIQSHLRDNGKAAYVSNGMICFNQNGIETPIAPVSDIPITMNGAAKHNIHNALLVVAMMFSMKIDLDSIKQGLKTFDSSPENNPGRGNLFQVKGFQVLVDFAHNEHGLAAMANTLKSIKAKRRLVLLGQAGDRDDQLIKGLVDSALLANPDCLVVTELEEYLRGREKDEVPNLIKNHAIATGMKDSQIIKTSSPITGTQKALDWAKDGDVLLILALTHREEVIDLINKYS